MISIYPFRDMHRTISRQRRIPQYYSAEKSSVFIIIIPQFFFFFLFALVSHWISLSQSVWVQTSRVIITQVKYTHLRCAISLNHGALSRLKAKLSHEIKVRHWHASRAPLSECRGTATRLSCHWHWTTVMTDTALTSEPPADSEWVIGLSVEEVRF